MEHKTIGYLHEDGLHSSPGRSQSIWCAAWWPATVKVMSPAT